MIQIDMEMPDKCRECRFLFDTLCHDVTLYGCFAMRLPLLEEEINGRPKDCPLQEVEDKQEIIIPEDGRPKGKWELFEKRPYQNLYMCSKCGHIIESMPDRLAENFKGCYCGADMRGDV